MVKEGGLERSEPRQTAVPLGLEIFQDPHPPVHLAVRLKNLSARGAVLSSPEPPAGLDWRHLAGRQCVIHLPGGELRDIRAHLLWGREVPGREGELEFGLELASSHLALRRALEEHLQSCPEDLKNLWDHWDALHAGDEPPCPGTRPAVEELAAPSWSQALSRQVALESPDPGPPPGSPQAIYLVGFGAVAAGSAIYFWGPEAYRLFGVILALYGSLAIAGRSLWSLLKRSSRSRSQAGVQSPPIGRRG